VTDREAQEIIRMIEANWQCDYGKEGRELWRSLLSPYDPGLGTRAVALLAKEPLPGNRYRPQVADLRQHLRRLSQQARDESFKALGPGPRVAIPEWVERWRQARAVKDERVFPEQIPGYNEMQTFHPDNAKAYVLPASPTTNAEDWVQSHEYVEATA